MNSGVKSRLKCYALHVIFIKRIQHSIRNKLNNANFNLTFFSKNNHKWTKYISMYI